MKDCFIKYEKAAVNTTVMVCRKPLVRDCGVDSSEEFCSTQYETECTTLERVHQVSDLLGVEPGRDGAFSYLVGVWGDNQFGQSIRYDN